MGLFRHRKETLNEKLLREAGLDEHPPQPEPPRSVLHTVGVPDGSGVGPKDWDTAVAVTAPALTGDRIEFTTLPNGDLIVGEESGDGDLSPLADAVERKVYPPYRAVAERKDGDLWAVAAKRIEVAEIAFPEGDRLQLSQYGEDQEFRVDSEPSHAPVPVELERAGDAVGDSFYVEADRIDGDLWEVKASPV